MGGKSLKFQVKQAIKLSEAVQIGKQKAQEKRPLSLELKDQAKMFLQKIDPLELTAIIGTTWIVYNGLDWIQYWTKTISNISEQNQEMPLFWIIENFSKPILKALGFDIEVLSKASDKNAMQIFKQVLLSFSIAYLLVKHFGAIASSTTDLITLAGRLLGLSQ